MTYHSQFCKNKYELALGIPIMPLKGGSGPAPKCDDSTDIVDEAITLFRSTILFKNFRPEGPADKVIVYLTCFIQKALYDIIRVKNSVDLPKADAIAAVNKLVAEPIPGPTDQSFFMKQLGLLASGSPAETKKMQEFFNSVKKSVPSA